jgi:pyruvate formate lyase activating enzyme
MDARYYIKKQNSIQCLLCPHQCILKDGDKGICLIRRNEGGKLIADTYGVLSAIHMDPIEKKPLYHYFPGKNILSLGSYGCNMKCKCCQNFNISQNGTEGTGGYRNMNISLIIEQAKQDSSNIGLAYTYNEPTVWYEFMYDIAKEAWNNDLKNVVVSNGYICEEPLLKLLPLIDAFNIDLKGFNATTHKKFTKADLNIIKRNLEIIYNSGKHLEITHLVVPGFNDSTDEFERLITWIKDTLSPLVPLHISRYYPAYKYNEQPVDGSFLESYYQLASDHLSYVYVGNIHIPGRSDTFCRKCGHTLIERSGYHVTISGLDKEGNCNHCNTSNIKYI